MRARGPLGSRQVELRLGTLVAVLAGLLAVALAAPAGALAVTDGAISGKVTSAATGEPIEGIEVCAFKYATGGKGTCRRTGADGTYLLPEIIPGPYYVWFKNPNEGTLNYSGQYFNEGEHFTVASGATTPNIDASLRTGGKIEGTVRNQSTSLPIEHLLVCATSFEEFGEGCARTDAGGKYTIYGLPPGEYVVEFSPFEGGANYLTQYFEGNNDEREAPVLVREAATSTGIDASLREGAEITGRVVEAGSEAPIPGIEVCATSGSTRRCEDSEPGGTYTIAALPAGVYHVSFSSESPELNFVEQVAATSIELTPGHKREHVDASLKRGGEIVGTVRSTATSEALANVGVCAWVGAFLHYTCATTDSEGGYRIDRLPGGEYTVQFQGRAENGHPEYLSQYWNGKASASEASPVPVTEGAPTEHVDASLESVGRIAGTVTTAATKAPLAGVRVCAGYFYFGENFGTVACAQSREDGTYSLPVAAGSYVVLFYREPVGELNYALQYYSGEPSPRHTEQVTVTDGTTTPGIDAAMQTGGTIAGTVTSATTKEALEGIRVCAIAQFSSGCGTTKGNGVYEIDGLASGAYEVRFEPGFGHGDYLGAYYDNKPSATNLDYVYVNAEHVTEKIDAALNQGATIKGRVTSAEKGTPLEEVSVCAIRDQQYQGCTRSQADGTYEITGLVPGAYSVRFTPSSPYLIQFYKDEPNLSVATPVTLRSGGTEEGIDAALGVGGAITGKVEGSATHEPIEGIRVCAEGIVTSRCEATGAHGSYSLTGLPTGSYQVTFDGARIDGTTYLTQYYDGTESLAAAQGVSVVAGASPTEGIDAAMHSGGEVSGRVVNAAEAPVERVEVCAGGRCTFTDSAGDYALTSLAPGEYEIQFYPGAIADEEQPGSYYDEKSVTGQHAPVTVINGGAVSGVDATLHTEGALSGTVTSAATSTPLAGVEVCATETGYREFVDCETTGLNGEYKFTGLPSGSYDVSFAPAFGTPYLGQFFDNEPSLQEADPVVVHDEASTPPVDASLHIGGVITGTVTNSVTSGAVEGISVCAREPSSGSEGCAKTVANGTYEIGGLRSGSYIVAFSPTSETARYVPQYYNDKAAYGEAIPVPVTLEHTEPGIDAAMVPVEVGEIAGKVTSNVSKEPLKGITVCAVPAVGGESSECTQTASDGTYAMRKLTPGEYHVQFTRGSAVEELLPQYYKDAASEGEAVPVAMSVGHPATEVNAAMHAPGRVSGTVRNQAGDKLEGIEVCAFGGSVSCAITKAGGEYEVRGLAGGLYTVRFSTTSGHAYLTDYYQEKLVAQEATQFLVTPESLKTEVNAVMRSGGSITGTVTDAVTTHPVGGVRVCATGAAFECTSTNLDGTYRLSQLPPGEYNVAFTTGTSHGGYRSQFYEGTASVAEAKPVIVTLEAEMTGVNAAMETGIPLDTAAPTISGSAFEGSTLTETDGSWTNSPTARSHRWERCNAFSEGCLPIPGANGTTYQPVQEDVGQTIRLEEKAYNEDGESEPAYSTASAVVATAAPENTERPRIDGKPEVGQQLFAVHGLWTNVPTAYAYEWLRCESGGAECKELHRSGSTYTPVDADVGHVLEVQEVASNAAGGGAPARSDPTAPISGPVPGNTELPKISGAAEQGQTLSATPGAWTNTPTGYAYQWLRCGGGGCKEVPEATSTTYHVLDADVHHTLKVRVTASNAIGAGGAVTSLPTAEVVGQVPANITPPTAAGVAEEGETLAAASGTWTNEPSHFEYQWLRCEGGTCHKITGAVDETYRAAEGDIGSRLEVEETAVNSTGASAPVTSASSAAIATGRLRAVAGEDITTPVNSEVTFDGSGSTPAHEISAYKWDFGDGASSTGASIVRHAYTQAGSYTATLTVERGAEVAHASVGVTVTAPPAKAVTVTVLTGGSTPVPGAEVVYISAGGARIESVTDSEGVATLAGLPDGVDAIYAYAQGYQAATGQVTVEEASGATTVQLTPGAVATAKLTSHPMTLKEIEEAGIDPHEAANEQVYQFTSQIAFSEAGQESSRELNCQINRAAQFVGAGCRFSGEASRCSLNACQGNGVVAVPGLVENQPVVEWLILPGSVTVLKQFFTITMLVQNLSGEGFALTGGHATLNLPPGVSLAPTAALQSPTQGMGEIQAGGSATATWVVRGDEPGDHYLSADYAGTLSKVEAPVMLHAALAEPLHVWGAEALSLTVKADEGAPEAGIPYHVAIGVTNHAPVPLYNVSLNVEPTPPEHFLLQPGEYFNDTIAKLPAGHTLYSHTYIYVPSTALPQFNAPLSVAGFAGESTSGSHFEGVPAPHLSKLTAPTDTPNEVHLHWEPVPGATGYEVFATPNLETAFPTSPEPAIPAGGTHLEAKLPASTTDAFVPLSETAPPEYFALSAIVGGHLVLDSPVISAVAGQQPPSTGGGGPGGGAGKPTCAPGQKDAVNGHLLEASGCFIEGSNQTYVAIGKVVVNGIAFAPSSGTLTIDARAPAIRATGSGSIELAHKKVWAWSGSLNLLIPQSGKFIIIPRETKASVFGFAVTGEIFAVFKEHGEAELEGKVTLHVLGEDIEASLEIATDMHEGLAHAEIEVKAAEADPKVKALQPCPSGPAPTGWHCEKLTSASGKETSKLLANSPGVVRIGGVLPIEDLAASYSAEHSSWGARAALDLKDFLPSPDIVKQVLPTLEIGGEIGTDPLQLNNLKAGIKGLELRLGPAVLKELAFSLELHPYFEVGGDIELETLAHTMEIAAGLEYKRASGTDWALLVHGEFDLEKQLTVGGQVEFTEKDGAHKLLASGTLTKSWGPISASITIGGGFEGNHYELMADGSVGAFGANVQAHGVISDAGFGLCGEVHVFIWNGQAGVRHFWGGPYEFQECDFSGLYTIKASGASVAATGRSFTLPAGRSREEFVAIGASGPPSVTLVGPNGEELQTPATPDKLTASQTGLTLAETSVNKTIFIVNHPGRGVWRIAPTAGAVPPIAYEQADPLVPLGLSGHVTGTGRRRAFNWRLTPQHGETVSFVQLGGTQQAITTTTAGRGRASFQVASGPAGRRKIVAFVSFDGIPRQEITVASFNAPATPLPRVTRARYRLKRGQLTLSWRAVSGARYYELVLRTTLGLRDYRLAPSLHHLVLTLPATARVKTVLISTSAAGLTGPQVRFRHVH